MVSLKSLKMADIGGTDHGVCGHVPIHSRFPNVEHLDLTDNCLNISFLSQISEYCPSLSSLNLSGCALRYHDVEMEDAVPLVPETAFELLFLELRALTKLQFNCFIMFSRLKEERRLKSNDIKCCVENISHHLKDLEVLEMAEYSEITNDLVIHLIINLPALKQLKIQLCPKVDYHLFPKLAAHPDFKERTQKLKLFVARTGLGVYPDESDIYKGVWEPMLGDKIPDDIVVPDIIDLDFDTYILLDDYQCRYDDELTLSLEEEQDRLPLETESSEDDDL